MRFSEFYVEGINMGSKALSSPSKKDYTVGLEIEVYTDEEENISHSEFIEDKYERFANNWDGYTDFTIDDYINQKDIDNFDIKQIISGFEPRYGRPDTINFDILSDVFSEKKAEKIYDLLKVIKHVSGDYDWSTSPDDKELQGFLGDYISNAAPGEVKHIIKVQLVKHGIDKNGIIEDFFVYDSNDNVVFIPDEVDDADIFILEEYFDLEKEDIHAFFEDEYHEHMSEMLSDEFSDYMSSANTINNSGAIAYVQDFLNEHGFIKGYEVVSDFTDGVSAEILTPPQSVVKTISDMKRIFSLFDENNIETNNACGLHINVGTWGEEYNSVDWLKFMVVLNSKFVLNEFGRLGNMFTKDRLRDITTSLKINDVNLYNTSVQDINSFVLSKLDKFSAINFQKLVNTPNNRYIEVRAAGGADYHKNPDKIEKLIKRIIRSLEIASDPNAYKNEYLKILFKIAPPKDKDTGITKSPIAKSGEILGVRTPYNTIEDLLTGIIYKDVPAKDVDKAITSSLMRFKKGGSYIYHKLNDTENSIITKLAKEHNREDLLQTKLFRMFLQ